MCARSDLTNNALYCDCYLIEWMVNEAMNLTGGVCEAPPGGILLGYANAGDDNYFEERLVTNFTCCECHRCRVIVC